MIFINTCRLIFNIFCFRFLYTDKTNVTGDNVLALLYTSKKYNVSALSHHCLTFLNNGRSPDNICTILEQAHLYEEDEFIQKSIDYILVNAREVLMSSSFKDLCFQCVLKIISFDELQADERTVLEAVTKWGEHKCHRQKKEPNPENIRDVLGDILFAVRFPLLGENYFTNVVSDSNLLTDSEKVELFKFFYKSGAQVSSFISRNRYETCVISKHSVTQELKPDDRYIQTCMRFTSVCDDGSWYCGGEPDAIAFTSSQIIWLHGALVYGSYIGDGNYDITYSVYDASERELSQMRTEIKTSEHQLTYILMLDEPLKILKDMKYTLLVKVTNPDGIDTYQGKDGATSVNVGNVKFTFAKSKFSRNGTDVKMGQIPGLLFSSLT